MTTQKRNTSKFVEVGVILYTIVYFFFLMKDSWSSNTDLSLFGLLQENIFIPLTLMSVGIAYAVVKKAIESNMFDTLLSNRHAITMGSIFVAVAAWFIFIL